MHQTLLDIPARRWLIGVALLAGLAALIMALADTTSAQGRPIAPHWFWGQDADSYAGTTVQAFNQNGDELGINDDGEGVVGPDGGWYYSVLRVDDNAARVRFRLTNSSGSRETDLFDVVDGDVDEVPISAFSNEIPTTQSVRVIVRLHPDRTPRTLEFNLQVDGVDVDPAPRSRFFTPGLDNNRWYHSNPVSDLGHGFEARVIACRKDDGNVVFGVRVAGHDDILPRLRTFLTTFTDNNWKRSNPVEVLKPSDNDAATRLTADQGCTGGDLAP